MTYKIGNVKDDLFREVFNHKSKTQSKIEKKIINKYCLDLDIGTYLADMVEEGLLIKKKNGEEILFETTEWGEFEMGYCFEHIERLSNEELEEFFINLI